MRSRLTPSGARHAVGLSLLLVVSLAAAVGPVAAADARLTLTDTAVTPATPTVGAPITAETTLRLSAGSDTPMDVEVVRVVDSQASGESAVLGTSRDLGRLSPGETLAVPVTFTVNESGSQALELVAVGEDSDGQSVRATRPLTVGVERGAPQVEIQTDGLVAEADAPVRATVSNPTTAPLRGIEVAVEGESGRATIPTLAAGATETVNLTARAAEPGETTLAVTTTYTIPNGVELTARATESVTVAPLTTDIGLRAQQAQANDGQQGAGDLTGLFGGGGGGALQPQGGSDGEGNDARVDVTVTNFGNAAVEDVVLTAEDGDGARLASVGRYATADALAPGEATTVTVDLSGVRADDVRFVAAYETPRGTDESVLATDYGAERGEAALTGLDVGLTGGGRVTIDGNLANVGDGEVTSAVVSVRPTDGVQPAYPQRNYFVGTVDASSFAPFELTAQADPDTATDATVEVSYTVDGEQVTQTETVPLPPATDAGGGSVPVGAAVALMLGLAGVAAATVYVTRYR